MAVTRNISQNIMNMIQTDGTLLGCHYKIMEFVQTPNDPIQGAILSQEILGNLTEMDAAITAMKQKLAFGNIRNRYRAERIKRQIHIEENMIKGWYTSLIVETIFKYNKK